MKVDIAIIGAMEPEVLGLISAMGEHTTERVSRIEVHLGKIYGKTVAVARCGIGKVFAALCAEVLILKYSPSLLINTGVGGGLARDLKTGDIIVATDLCQHDMDTSAIGDPVGLVSGINKIYFEADKRALEILLNAAKGLELTARAGRVATGDKFIASKEAAGNAIGGLAVGEPAEKMYEMIEVVNEILPTDKPRYLMGVGTPANILEAIERGVDMFDCVMPTRNGRNAMLFTKHGIMNMRNEKWKYDFSPIEEDGASFVDTLYSKAYLRHLFAAQELLALEIASIHNLAFYVWLTQEARKHILMDDYASWKKSMLEEVTRRL